MTHSKTRRLLSTLVGGAMAVTGVGVGLITASPASARTICSPALKGFEHTGGYLIVEGYRICDDEIINLSVFIQQQNPTTLAWKTVATGSGTAAYKCQGTATKRYRITTTGNGAPFPCG